MKFLLRWAMFAITCAISLTLSANEITNKTTNEIVKNYPNKPITFIVAYGAGMDAGMKEVQDMANAVAVALNEMIIHG